MATIRIGSDEFSGEAVLYEKFSDLRRWRTLENHGGWTPGTDGLLAEWLEKSPSLFLKEKISGDYLWQTRLSRLSPDEEFLRRFQASSHAKGADPERFYNFNFWLRADAPPAETFFDAYPKYLGTGWNGMGDDHWHSLFNTVVWWDKGNPDNWVRLRRSPGYEKMRDIQGIVPHLPYGEPHEFSFALQGGRVRMYFDETLVYDFADERAYASGYLGFCVWLCRIRYHEMKLYRL
ncbi:MAG TPA: hypothetical protein VEJ63_12420 [Planctomycetota bacterium]|nr:hypothetical protein [Planctomycetota bacterium]